MTTPEDVANDARYHGHYLRGRASSDWRAFAHESQVRGIVAWMMFVDRFTAAAHWLGVLHQIEGEKKGAA